MLGATVMLYAVAPYASKYAEGRAAVAANLADDGRIDKAMGYTVADTLDGSGITYRVRLAEAQLDAWKPQEAITTLGSALDTPQALKTALRAHIEANRLAEVGQLIKPTEDSSLRIAAQTLVGQSDDASAGLPALSPAERQSAERLLAGGTAQAQELVRLGLPQAALRILESIDDQSPASAITQAQIQMANPKAGEPEYAAAENRLRSALSNDPSHLATLDTLEQLYRYTGKENEAQETKKRLDRLRSGSY